MEIALIVFFFVIVSTIAFIAKTYHWLNGKNEFYMNLPMFAPPTIIRAYRGVDLQTDFMYTPIEHVINQNLYPGYFAENIVHDIEHKQYLIKRQASKLTDEMLAMGLIEIEELEYPNTPNPFTNHARLKVKVYKPEN